MQHLEEQKGGTTCDSCRMGC